MTDWLPVLVMFVVAVGFALASLGASYLLSPKKATPEKLAPYECGIFPEVEPSQRFPVKFYMVAMLYIVFDIEIIFAPFSFAYSNALTIFFEFPLPLNPITISFSVSSGANAAENILSAPKSFTKPVSSAGEEHKFTKCNLFTLPIFCDLSSLTKG